MTGETADVEFKNGLLRLYSVAGDHLGFTQAVPLSRRRKTGGATFWEASAADAQTVTAWAESKGLRVSDEVREHASRLWREESRRLATAMATSPVGGTAPEVTGLTGTLLKTQEAVVAASLDAWFCPPGQKGIRHRAILLADDQGLGKTLTALAILRVSGREARKAVVVCPSSLTENWKKEAEEFFSGGTFTTWTATGKTPTEIPSEVDLVVVGWSILSDWAESLIDWSPEALIADEGHYAKSGKQRTRKETEPKRDENNQIVCDDEGNAVMVPVMVDKKGPGGKPVLDNDGKPKQEQKVTVLSGSARADAVLALGKAVSKRHGLVMPMTGTPIVNRPLELLSLIDFCGIGKTFVAEREFKERYCGPTWKTLRQGRQTRDYSGASNLLELNTRLLTSGVYFRRTKKVLVDQGLLKRKYVDKAYVYDYDQEPHPWIIRLTPEEQAEYAEIRDQTKDFFSSRAEEIAAQKRMGVDAQLVREKVAAEGAKHLKLINDLRQATARLKIPYVSEQVQKLIDRDEKVVIVAHHRDVVSAYAEQFGGLRIQGEMGVKAIEKAKAIFNGTPVQESPVMVLSVEAGKTGHTLCKQSLEGAGPACAYMIFAEQIWTPGDESQAQDRIWRIGQDREVFVSNAIVGNSIDESIYAQRQKKRWVSNAAIDSIDKEALDSARSEKAGAGEIARELVYGRVA